MSNVCLVIRPASDCGAPSELQRSEINQKFMFHFAVIGDALYLICFAYFPPLRNWPWFSKPAARTVGMFQLSNVLGLLALPKLHAPLCANLYPLVQGNQPQQASYIRSGCTLTLVVFGFGLGGFCSMGANATLSGYSTIRAVGLQCVGLRA